MTSRAFRRCACGHLWLRHDIEEYDGDGTDTCCVEGCTQLGCPGRSRAEGKENLVQKPSLGRVVIALVDPAINNGSDEAPAIITRVFSDTVVNVRVLLDGYEVPLKTSISLHLDRAAVEAARVKVAETSEIALEDVQMYAAFWPPRV